MTVKDKLEIGLKEDAPYRKDNVPPIQQKPGVPDTKPGDPTRSPVVPGARGEANQTPARVKRLPKKSTRTRAPKPVRKAAKRGR